MITFKDKLLKGKKILVTAGPVWVKIDPVRILTNIAGGSLGYVISTIAASMGADVTLLLGPGKVRPTGKEKFNIVPFKFYDELYKYLETEISTKKYDSVFHSCAVPDWMPEKVSEEKIKSGKGKARWKPVFVPTEKIVDKFKIWDSNIFVVKFKFEAGKKKEELLKIAYDSLKHSNADLMMANRREDVSDDPTKHIGYVITPNKKIFRYVSKDNIAENLLRMYKTLRV